ncbi:MAG: UDP-N-acetylglucosamine 2-epimerase (non-hydrolyzing) [Bacteroidia bacterium]|nr:UDP-N-acetylglucosamine 2-epimerase (non-hydrolyzing) [Bacteroidia bacterium]
MKIISIVGARPNFMKIAPFIRAIGNHNKSGKNKIEHILVHTGQHYDVRMSQKFFDDLNIPPADIHLEIGSGSHAEQVGKTMIEFEKVVRTEKPDWIIVVGDVNAICAASIVAKKEHVKLAHIEAGLRSGDITMPEEVNRLVADRLSDLLLTPDRISNVNLEKEGVSLEKIKFVGNIMIDTLESERVKAENIELVSILNENLIYERSNFPEIENDKYAVVTLHRPSNVDKKEILSHLVDFLSDEVAKDIPVIWPIHPRTQKTLVEFGLMEKLITKYRMIILQPLGYHSMLRLNMHARVVLTDSGGLQEECTVLGTPCLTLRWNTERPVTLIENGGASVLVGNNIERIREEYLKTLNFVRNPVKPELWDGKTSERIVIEIINSSKGY